MEHSPSIASFLEPNLNWTNQNMTLDHELVAEDEHQNPPQFVAVKFIKNFADIYQMVHYPIVIGVSVFGILSNMLNMVILRQDIMNGAVNALLLSLSFSQMALLLNNLVVTILGIISPSLWDLTTLALECDMTYRSYQWLHFVLLNVNMSLVFHNISIVHVTILAVVRYIVICCRGRFARHFFSMLFSKIVIPIVYLSVPVICVPFYLNSSVKPLDVPYYVEVLCEVSPNQTDIYTIGFSQLAENTSLLTFNFWFFSILFKLVPCAFIVLLNLRIICKLRHHDRRSSLMRRRRLTAGTGGSVADRRRSSCSGGRYGNISRILCLVVSFFFVIEFPQALLNLMSGVYGPSFMKAVHKPLANFFDMLTVLYSSVNFVLYCMMSAKFRKRFRQLCCCWHRSVSADAVDENGAQIGGDGGCGTGAATYEPTAFNSSVRRQLAAVQGQRAAAENGRRSKFFPLNSTALMSVLVPALQALCSLCGSNGSSTKT